jgi:hypothetical protein
VIETRQGLSLTAPADETGEITRSGDATALLGDEAIKPACLGREVAG